MIIDGHYPLNKKLTSSLLSQLRNGLLVNGHINCLAVQLTAIKGLLGLTVGFGRYGLLKNKGFPNGNFNGEDDILISLFSDNPSWMISMLRSLGNLAIGYCLS